MSTRKEPLELQAGSMESAAADMRPRVMIMFGRGGVGKSVAVRYMGERALSAGRPVIIADFDRNKPVLASFFCSVHTPPGSDDLGVREGLAATIEEAAAIGQTVVIDTTGGDMILQTEAKALDLAALIESLGFRPVAVHVVGQGRDDLADLYRIEREEIFCPRDTWIVFNDGNVTSGRSDRAFEEICRDETIRAAVRRGAVLLRMPKLEVMLEITNRRLSFCDAREGRVTGDPPLGPFARQRMMIATRRWLDEAMPAAFASVADVLP
jgi:hypothetical protein